MGYTFKGVYGSEDMGQYSYFINNKLYWLRNQTMESGSMRAYLKSSAVDEALAKPIMGISFDLGFDDTEGEPVATSVEELVLDNQNADDTRSGVYTLSGVKVAQQESSLDGLPKGIYLVNGKKVAVK